MIKCLICQDVFSKKNALKHHFVETHGIPENDEVLNRYVHLRFSNFFIGDGISECVEERRIKEYSSYY